MCGERGLRVRGDVGEGGSCIRISNVSDFEIDVCVYLFTGSDHVVLMSSCATSGAETRQRASTPSSTRSASYPSTFSSTPFFITRTERIHSQRLLSDWDKRHKVSSLQFLSALTACLLCTVTPMHTQADAFFFFFNTLYTPLYIVHRQTDTGGSAAVSPLELFPAALFR